MSRSASLTVVVPRTLERHAHPLSKDSVLARVAGRGDVAHMWGATTSDEARLEAWQRGLLAALGLAQASHPSAPATALGLGHAMGEGDWLHAEPIHLAAGLNEVTLVPLRDHAALTRDEFVALTPALGDHFAASGVRLHETSGSSWLLETPRWDVQTVTAEFARQHEWRDVLPQGADSGALRRLMTEIQMVLHDHAVNERRGARGAPAANALWFWGNGPFDAKPQGGEMACVGHNHYLAGVCRRHGWKAPAELTTAQALVAHARERARVIAVIEETDLHEFELRWLAPLIDALKSNRIARLELIVDEWRVVLDRWQWRRFWRRSLPIDAWVSA